MVSDAHRIGMNKNQSRGLRRLFNIERIRLIRAGIIRLIPLLMHERCAWQPWQNSPCGDKASLADTKFLEAILADCPKRDFQVRFWDGTSWGSERQPRFTLVLKHQGALRAMFSRPSELTLGEAYIYDDFDIEGDIEAIFELADYLLQQERSIGTSFDLAKRRQKLPVNNRAHKNREPANFGGSVHSRDRDRQAISYHYDLPADFYALWLDQRMAYSCAYFTTPEEDLNLTQERKLDYICRKLRLRQHDHLLDIGCGWGGLIMHAVAHYGVEAVRDHAKCATGGTCPTTTARNGFK
jgi:cyclopropane-fatty-acyl-phospholipid synthase